PAEQRHDPRPRALPRRPRLLRRVPQEARLEPRHDRARARSDRPGGPPARGARARGQGRVTDAVYLIIIGIAVVLMIARLARKPTTREAGGLLWFGPAAAIGAVALGEDNFGILRLFSWATFVLG